MIGGLKPHLEYLPCDLTWIKTIPRDWSIMRGKGVFEAIDVRSRTGSEEMLTVSASDGVVPRRQKSVTMFMAKSYIGHKLCWPGDLVVNSLWAWMQGLGVAREHGLISSAYSVYRPRLAYRDYSRFFHHLLRSAAYKWELLTRSKGVWLSRLQLSDLSFMDMPILLPPPAEQAAIVRFVEYVDRQLGHAIRAKRKLIALLNEQKQAVIHRYVTHGIDSTVGLKSSGISWLGDIPQHWDVVPLKVVCTIQTGVTLGKIHLNGSSYPYLRVANVQAGRLDLRRVKTIRLPLTEAERSMLQVGDVLMTEGGDPDKLGRGCVWTAEIAPCLHQNHIFAVRPRKHRLVPEFLAAVLSSWYSRAYFQQTCKQTTNLASTNQTTIGSFRLPLPSIEEQQAILERLGL